MSIFVTSDLHFCHNRIFLYEPRGFSSVEEMNKAIVKNWNEVVTDDDDVYVLGDLMLNDNEAGLAYLAQLKGKLHVILGNHDTEARIKLYKDFPSIVEVSFAYRLKYGKYNFYLTHYPTLTDNGDNEPVWTKVINLCGHTHTSDKFLDWDKGPIYHVELDAHNNRPVKIEDVIEDIRNKDRN